MIGMRGWHGSDRGAALVEASDYDRFDWIIGMTREHQQFLRERRRSHDQAQILLITAFSTNPGFREIADPFSQGQEAYDLALDQIERCCADIFLRVRASVAA